MPDQEDIRPKLRVVPSSGHGGEDCCGFCGKRRSDVASLVAGPDIFICNECVAACNKILHQDA